jgi:alanine racemase
LILNWNLTNGILRPLKPVLEMHTTITSLRNIEAGESVGYNATYTATEKRRLASIPVGYAEGLDRRLSSKGSVMVKGKICPIVGRISMNITTLDVSDLPELNIGEKAVVISADPDFLNSMENMAKLCGTIPYDIAIHIPSQLRRVIV